MSGNDEKLYQLNKLITENNNKIIEYQKIINQLEKDNLSLEKQIEQLKEAEHELKLNPQQLDAVKSSSTNSIIIACPGSGKTHTLISKVIHLIKNKKVNPNKIILITFTKKASQEMNERLKNMLGYYNNNNLLHIGTIHGLAYRILQKFDAINYTILDEKDSNKAINTCYNLIIKNNNENLSQEIISLIHKKITFIHDMITSYYPKPLIDILRTIKLDTYHNIIKSTIDKYSQFKIENKYLDFNDLMIRFLQFLQSDRAYQFKEQIEHILFDEYQDVNSIQNMILKELHCSNKNLTVVGDDAQAIYAFRGSQVRYIMNFKEAFNNVQIFRLEQNYRSTPEIINFCNDIIKNNNEQLDKNMIPVKKVSYLKPKITGFINVKEEVKHIISRIKNNRSIGIKLRSQAIITRKNRQLDNFELELIKNKISYVKTKGIGLMDRVHIKDFMAFLIILANHDAIIHFKRILSLIPKIGTVSINKIINKSRELKVSVLKILNNPMQLGSKVTGLLYEFIKMLNKLLKLYNDKEFGVICDNIINFLKPIIQKGMKMKEQTTYEEKIEDLETMKSYVLNSGSIVNFLADIHLNIDINNIKDGNSGIEECTDEDLDEINNGPDYLLLSTIHGAKGLEWDCVYLAGCSSDIMPSFKPNLYLEELNDIEEERRLFYVGCSRAKKSLEITLSYDYHFVSNQIYASPFIKEINEDLYDGKNIKLPKRLYKGDITHIINNYLLLESTSKIHNYLKKLNHIFTSFYDPYFHPLIIKHNLEVIYGTFIDNLIAKMIFQHYNNDYNIILDVPIYEKYNMKKDKSYFDYIDPNNDWRDNIMSILKVSIKRKRLKISFDAIYNIVSSKEQIELYNKIYNMMIVVCEDALTNLDPVTNNSTKPNNSAKPNNTNPDIISPINLHYNISFGEIMGEADIVIGRTLIEIKTSRMCIANTKYLLQTIMYRYLLRKKGLRIDRIILLNPLLGEIYSFNITPEWKDTFRVYNAIINK